MRDILNPMFQHRHGSKGSYRAYQQVYHISKGRCNKSSGVEGEKKAIKMQKSCIIHAAAADNTICQATLGQK